MTSLAEVLAWKFDNASGIRTRERRNAKGKPDGSGEMKIFDWPETLGPEPSPALIAQWTAEFNALPPRPPRFENAAQAVESAADWNAAKAILAQAFRDLA